MFGQSCVYDSEKQQEKHSVKLCLHTVKLLYLEYNVLKYFEKITLFTVIAAMVTAIACKPVENKNVG